MREKSKRTIGIIIIIVFCALLMGIALSSSLEILLLLTIGFSIIYLGTADKQERKRAKYYILSLIIVSGLILTYLFIINQDYRHNPSSGEFYFQDAKSNDGIYSKDANELKEYQFPENAYVYIKTDHFGQTNFSIRIKINNLNINTDDIDNFSLNYQYLYDSEIDNIKFGKIHIVSLSISDIKDGVLIKLNCNTSVLKYDHEFITHLFQFNVKLNKILSCLTANIKINIDANTTDIYYGVLKESMLPEGQIKAKYVIFGWWLYFLDHLTGKNDTEAFAYNNLLFGDSGILVSTAIIIMAVYFIFIVASLVYQRFDIFAVITPLIAIICILILLWWLAYNIDTGGSTSSTALNILKAVSNIIDSKELEYLLIIVIASMQWSYTVGIVMVIMFLVSKALAELFGIDTKLYAKQLAIQVMKGGVG
ncbi:MAG: hypothetical protein ACP6IY_18520 [Promethearchaeia archaeon]